MWHQVTVRLDASVAGTATCEVWIDQDSDETPDLRVSNSGMSEVPADIDGVRLLWIKDNTAVHFDFLQVDDTESDLVDVYGGDCRNDEPTGILAWHPPWKAR
jgi:hypothetical protein